MCAFALLLVLLTASTWAQPLTRGVEIGDTRYLIEGGKIKALQQGKLENLDLRGRKNSKLIQNPQELVQPSAAWTDSFLIKAENGLFQFKDGKIVELFLSDPPGGKLTRLGDFVVWQRHKATVLQVYGPEGLITTLEVPLIHSGPHPIGKSKLLVLNTDQTYELYRVNTWDKPKTGTFPMSTESVQVTVSGKQALLWARDHTQVLLVTRNISHTLFTPPTRGVKALAGDSFALGLPGSVDTVSSFGNYRSYPITETDKFDDFGILLRGAQAQVLLPSTAGSLVSMAFEQRKHIGASLGKMTLKTLVPPRRATRDLPILFAETELEETKIDRWGKVVIDPKTGLEETRTVTGHKVFTLGQSVWRGLTGDPRARLVGPAEVVGPCLVYATQTKPEDQVGVKRPYNGRFPYPKIVLHGVDPADGSEVWRLDLPRGKAPALARLPEEHWPVWGENHALLFTTEENRLAALDPFTGNILWTTGQLALDDSRPAMFGWKDSLGLVATMHTTKKMILFDNQGKRLGAFRLNPIFNSERTLNLLGVIVICLALVIYIYIAGKKKLFIRRIAGLEALDEAVGRATEMGKPVLYVTGLADVDDIQTLASLSILSHVAKKTAEYDASIIATTSRAVTFSAAQEVVRDAFTIAGRPDSFHIDSVQYISDDQFGYAAGVDGIMVREEPAANFYMGKFYAESLIFAETGHSTGAIQIAGTAMPNQLPFFVAACDYTLIGEELFAASAYLSGDPLQVGSLRGQDVGKAIVMIFLVLAAFLVTADSGFGWAWAGKLTSFFGGLLS